MLYSDMVGLGLPSAPVVLVYGHGAVRDADLQANADKYIRLAMTKYPAAYKGQPKFLLKRQAWYFARIWIEVTPLKILWWPEGKIDETAREWTAPTDAPLPELTLHREGSKQRPGLTFRTSGGGAQRQRCAIWACLRSPWLMERAIPWRSR